jgi:hypothetical protein
MSFIFVLSISHFFYSVFIVFSVLLIFKLILALTKKWSDSVSAVYVSGEVYIVWGVWNWLDTVVCINLLWVWIFLSSIVVFGFCPLGGIPG